MTRRTFCFLLLLLTFHPAYADGSLRSVSLAGEMFTEAIRLILSLTSIASLIFLYVLRVKLMHRAISIVAYIIIFFSFYFTYKLSEDREFEYIENSAAMWTPVILLVCIAALFLFVRIDLRSYSPELYSRIADRFNSAFSSRETQGKQEK